ncbi:MAG TPA: putative inorganic carbon transporter subunit DabA, partial [Pirellulales bacterium]|nr:putative inorganic carbon transporter subunit DabA [Pirellulales bacterium]
MNAASSQQSSAASARQEADRCLIKLAECIERAAQLLPAQGPITVFITHNTLHAFEDLEFNEAVKRAGHIFGCDPYLSEDRYRDALRRGRIRFSDLQAVLEQDLGAGAGESLPCFEKRLDLRLAMLQYPLLSGPTVELVWYVAENSAMRRVRPEASSAVRARLISETRHWVMRDLRGRPGRRQTPSRPPSVLAELLDRFGESTMENWTDQEWEGFTLQALWRVCCEGVRELPQYTTRPALSVRHRDLLLEATGVDADSLVHARLIPLVAAFLDQGFARWQLPWREDGFWRAFGKLYRPGGGPPDRWLQGLQHELSRLDERQAEPLESIYESLEILGVAPSEWDSFLADTLLALRGWGGMVAQIELRGDRVARPVPSGSVVDFVAVRLLLDRFAVAHVAREYLGFRGPLAQVREACGPRLRQHWPPSVPQRAFLVFQLAQIVGLSPDMLYRLNPDQWATIVREIETFGDLERRRIFHLAYEKRFATQTLDAISLHAQRAVGRPASAQFQLCCCLDDREESFRRHLEEIAPDVETFGAAGFYNVAMYYRGAADAHFVPLCPEVIRPQQWVTEEVRGEAEEVHRRRARTRRALGTATHRLHIGSRTFAAGAVLAGLVGGLASVPLIARILFPRLTGRVRQLFGRVVRTPLHTGLRLERTEPTPGSEGEHVGYSVDEMAEAGERLLRDIGLTRGFSRLV